MKKINRYYRIITAAILILTKTGDCVPNNNIADWTILTYIQADNNLAPFANYNIYDMELAVTQAAKSDQNKVNILVQWDQPNNFKTWRYKITPMGKIEDESVNQEMGLNPAQEIIDAMQWVKKKYPAKYYGLILWNHGSGVEDYRFIYKHLPKSIQPNIKYPFITNNIKLDKDRGILYDDSQKTCLTNQDLSTALEKIKQILGQNLSILGMDACLMAMVEIVYQIRECVDILVASEETEPGYGWSYSGFISPLINSPTTFTPSVLAQNIVHSYEKFYKLEDPDYTQSAIWVDKITDLRTNLDQVVNQIKVCKKYMPFAIKEVIIKARNATQTFAIDSYIDLYSFYSELIKQCEKEVNSYKKTTRKTVSGYTQEVKNLSQLLSQGLLIIDNIVFANVAGDTVPGAHGISIYYPNTRYSSFAIHSSYAKTQFAKDSQWLEFIKEYRKK